jgi:dsRNA-specific ribonuclease/signal transduction histidine kinase
MCAGIIAPEIPVNDKARAILRMLSLDALPNSNEALRWITFGLQHPGRAAKGASQQLAMLKDLGDSYFDLLIAHLVFLRNPDAQPTPYVRLVNGKTGMFESGERMLELAKKIQFPSELEDSLKITEGNEVPVIIRRQHHQLLGALSLFVSYSDLLRIVAKTYGVPVPGDETLGSYKGILQEWTQAKGLGLPSYSVQSQGGPQHSLTFEVCVQVTDGTKARGTGASKRRAEEAAAHTYLEKFSPKSLSIRTEHPVRWNSLGIHRREMVDRQRLRKLAETFSFPHDQAHLLLRGLTHSSATPLTQGNNLNNRLLSVLGSFLLTTVAKRFLIQKMFYHSRVESGSSLAVAAGLLLDKTAIAPFATEMMLLPNVVLGGTQKFENLSIATKADFVKAYVAARFLAWPTGYDLQKSLPPALRKHFDSISSKIDAGKGLKSPISRLMEFSQELGLIVKFETSLLAGPAHAREATARLTLTSPVSKEALILRGGKGSNTTAARHALSAQILGLIRAIHFDLANARTMADVDTVEKLAALTLPQVFACAPSDPREAARWRAEGLLGSDHLLADDFDSFAKWANEAMRYLPADVEHRERDEAAALNFYAQMPAPRNFDILSFARRVIDEIVQFADSDDALSTVVPIQKMAFFAQLQELLQVINLGSKERTHHSSLTAEFAGIQMLRRRDTDLSFELQDGSASWREREGSCLELISHLTNWLTHLIPASKLLFTSVSNSQEDTFTLRIARVGGGEQKLKPPEDFNQSLLLAFLRADGFLLDIRFNHQIVAFTCSAGLRPQSFVEKVRVTIAAPFRGTNAISGNVLGRILHDLKNHLLGVEVASRRTTRTRTERLLAQAEASRHLDSVRRLGGALGVLTGAMEQPELDDVPIREFFRSYCASLLNRLPQTVALNVPRNLTVSTIRTSKAFLESILENLVRNAVEAMKQHGQLSIEWTVSLETNSLVFFVVDTGPGMDEELLGKLISGAPIRSYKASGSGVGMITVTSMLRRLGGELRGESNVGEGTAWTVTIPSVEAASKERAIDSFDLSVTESFT